MHYHYAKQQTSCNALQSGRKPPVWHHIPNLVIYPSMGSMAPERETNTLRHYWLYFHMLAKVSCWTFNLHWAKVQRDTAWLCVEWWCSLVMCTQQVQQMTELSRDITPADKLLGVFTRNIYQQEQFASTDNFSMKHINQHLLMLMYLH